MKTAITRPDAIVQVLDCLCIPILLFPLHQLLEMASSVNPLSRTFLERPTLEVARDLIGVRLCRRVEPKRIIRLEITEVEAYDGPEDRACHAHKGRTKRTEIMFGPAGYWYVYLVATGCTGC